MNLYLSRLKVSQTPSVAALKKLIDPDDPNYRYDAHHRLLWSAFSGEPDQRRDFLWRSFGRGCFIVLSRRPPANSPLLEPPEIKTFNPELTPGDHLAFKLRVNATVTKKSGDLAPNGKPRRRHHDIVMEALRHVDPGPERAKSRMAIARREARQWLESQGDRHGFAILDMNVEDYSIRALPSHKSSRKGQPQFGVLDLVGSISVSSPDALLTKVAEGFGRAKAYGYGLMLIKRA